MLNTKSKSNIANTNRRRKRDVSLINPINKNLKLEKLDNAEIPIDMNLNDDSVIVPMDIANASNEMLDNPALNIPVESESNDESNDESNKPVENESNKPVENESNKPVENESDKPIENESDKPIENESDKPIENESDKPIENESNNVINEPAENESNDALNDKDEQKNSYEYYLSSGYCKRKNGKDQYYAKDTEGNEIYWTDETGDNVYAYKTVIIEDKEQKMEYAATLIDGTPLYIFDQGTPRYPENLMTRKVIFPVDSKNGDELYIPNIDGEIQYPKNKYGEAFYRKNAYGDEIPINDYTYAKNSDGCEIYPKLRNGDEYYLKSEDGLVEVGATILFGDEKYNYYAKKSNGDEFYPRQWSMIPIQR